MLATAFAAADPGEGVGCTSPGTFEKSIADRPELCRTDPLGVTMTGNAFPFAAVPVARGAAAVEAPAKARAIKIEAARIQVDFIRDDARLEIALETLTGQPERASTIG